MNVLQLLDVLAGNADEEGVAVVQSWTSFSATGRVSEGRSFAIFLRWKKEVLHHCLMWASKVRLGSILTLRFVTEDERWMSWPEKAGLVFI